MKHGALAVVHSPHDPATVERIAADLEPRNELEREVAKRLAHDLLRLDRVQQMAEAAIALKQDDLADEDAELRGRLEAWDKLREHWESINQRAEMLAGSKRSELVDLFSGIQQALVALATQVQKEFKVGDAHGILDDARWMAGCKTALTGADAKPDTAGIAKVLKDVSRLQADRIYDLTRGLAQRVLRREELRTELNVIPPDDVVRKIDRYTRTIQNSMLRHLAILKGLRELQGPPIQG
jgi:hypothetical protein